MILEEYDQSSFSKIPSTHRIKLIPTPTPYKNQHQFNLPYQSRPYTNQFNKIYSSRLSQLRPRAIHSATKKWGKDLYIQDKKAIRKEKVLEIEMDQPSWCCGTIYCEMKYKPNILTEVTKGGSGNEFVDVDIYNDPDLDEIFLEDESGRIKLTGDILDRSILVTGIVIGVLGIQLSPGVFSVLDIVYPFASAQKPTRTSKGKLALVSGLEFDGVEDFKYDLLVEYLNGGFSQEAQDISKLMIVGNSVNIRESTTDENISNNYGANYKTNYSIDSLVQLDTYLSQLLTSIPIDLIPGETDPVEISLPQQPFHPSFFTNSKKYINSTEKEGALNNLTNPSWLQYEDLRILAISGQNVDDVYKYVNFNSIDRMDMIESTLLWQNIIPTAPDTLFCYPYEDTDPFCLNELPHVYIVGNQPSFDERVVRFEDRGIDVKCISLPKFKQSGQFVVLDLDTLVCELVTVC